MSQRLSTQQKCLSNIEDTSCYQHAHTQRTLFPCSLANISTQRGKGQTDINVRTSHTGHKHRLHSSLHIPLGSVPGPHGHLKPNIKDVILPEPVLTLLYALIISQLLVMPNTIEVLCVFLWGIMKSMYSFGTDAISKKHFQRAVG